MLGFWIHLFLINKAKKRHLSISVFSLVPRGVEEDWEQSGEGELGEAGCRVGGMRPLCSAQGVRCVAIPGAQAKDPTAPS